MIVYLLFYDTDTGAREEWNTYHTPVEVFSDPAKRAARMAALQSNDPSLEFHTTEVEVDAP